MNTERRTEDKCVRERRKGFLARFIRDRSGSTAIEFVMLAMPFSLLVFAILESCIAFGGQQLLANVTDDVARQLRTGEIQADDLDEAGLRRMICDELEIMVAKDCPGLEVDLQNFDTFEQAAALRIRYVGSGPSKDIDTAGFGVEPGPALSKNMLRVFYRWPVMTDFMRKSMSNIQGSKTLLFATATWQNEPFN